MWEGRETKASAAASCRHRGGSKAIPILGNQPLAALPKHMIRSESSYNTIIRLCARLYEYAHEVPPPNSFGKGHVLIAKLQMGLFQIAKSSMR